MLAITWLYLSKLPNKNFLKILMDLYVQTRANNKV